MKFLKKLFKRSQQQPEEVIQDTEQQQLIKKYEKALEIATKLNSIHKKTIERTLEQVKSGQYGSVEKVWADYYLKRPL